MNFSILLVLKDRSHYTMRLMNKWNAEKFPYKIWIADGGQDHRVELALVNKQNFEIYIELTSQFINNLGQKIKI